MLKVCPNVFINDFLILLYLFDMHPKIKLNVTFMDRMDRFSRSRCAHAYVNPFDTKEQMGNLQTSPEQGSVGAEQI